MMTVDQKENNFFFFKNQTYKYISFPRGFILLEKQMGWENKPS